MYLNELKFQTNAALNLRIHLTKTELPAVKAALGQEGIVEGTDYRGVMVIANVHGVPNSPWFLVAKMDTAEVYAPLRQGQWIVVMAIVVLLCSAGAGVALVWQQSTKAQYRALFESEKARNESESKYRMVVDNASEAILVVQDEMLQLVNPGLLAMLGCSEQELKSKPFSSFVHPDDRAMVADRHQKMMQGETVPTRYSFRLITKDGSTRWVETNVAQINWKGRPAALALLGDITERKRA